MIMDPAQMGPLLQLLQSNPDQAAALLASTGLRPEQLLQGGGGIGALAGGGTGMSGPDQLIAAPAQAPATQPLPQPQGAPQPQAAIGPWETTTVPAGAQPSDPNLGALMAGLKGLSAASSDQRPIFGANAPAPRATSPVPPAANMQALQMLLASPGASAPGAVPTLGALMR